MKPAEISQQLPNGFHGARIERITTNYARRSAEIKLFLLVPDPPNESRFRGGKLRIDGFAYLSLDAPDPHHDYASLDHIEVGGLLDTTPKILPTLTTFQQELGNTYFFHSFFVEEWNGFIHFAGIGADFAWTED